MRQLGALAALLLFLVALPSPATAYGDQFTRLVDLQSAHTLPRAEYSLGVRATPSGGLRTSFALGAWDYVLVGVSYGALNVIGTGEPDWDDEVEFELKVRLAEEFDIMPAIAIGYDSRGYGSQLPDGGYEKASQGLYVAAAKTAPFSEFWQFHGGLSRTLEVEKVDLDFFLGATGRFSREFSVVAEYQLGATRKEDGSDEKNGYLNLGFRWVFAEQLEIAFYFRNLIGPGDSPDVQSRALSFAYYDSF
jgi:hypothetical protein